MVCVAVNKVGMEGGRREVNSSAEEFPSCISLMLGNKINYSTFPAIDRNDGPRAKWNAKENNNNRSWKVGERGMTS